MTPAEPQPSALELVSRTRILPHDHTSAGTHTVPLSILDSTTVKFALTGAVWYYDKPTRNPDAFSPDIFSKSLQETLHVYPQWAGQLQWMPYDLSRGLRHGRVCISYGSPTDPGIEFVVTRYPETLLSLLPDREARMKSGVWNADDFPATRLLFDAPLALHNTKEYAGRPSVSVQLNTFACGGISITLRIAHPIADATAMHQFVKDWAAVHRALLDGQPLPILAPVFDPRLIDTVAAGDLTKPSPDPEILRISHSLPMVKNDWWVSAPDCPAPLLPSTAVPPELEGTDLGPPGTPAPWKTWDIFAPVSYTLVYFTPAEVQRIWEAASAQLPAGPPRVSRLDALLAHLWRLVSHARGQQHDTGPNNFIVTMGLRTRLAPPLPDAFLGSPITLTNASLTGKQLAEPTSLGAAAAAIRAALAAFTPDALAAYLHELAYEVNPQRFWRAFLGERNSVVTSWLGLDPYGVDFGGGAPPRYVDAIMPNLDGLFHTMEAGPLGGGKGRWYEEPVCVSIHLATDITRKLLENPELRKYRDT